MRIAVIHGYFLYDSGSAIYTRELARQFVRQGHEVTLICQEQHGADYDFIDSVFDLSAGNSDVVTVLEREPAFAGSCRLVRPHINGRMLTFVAGPFPGFEAVPFQDAPTEWIDGYTAANVKALQTIFDRWPTDFVLANHLIMQPYEVDMALAGKAPYVVTVHGSELNFTVLKDHRTAPYAAAGLKGAAGVIVLSRASAAELTAFTRGIGLDVAEKTSELPPGVDTDLFAPINERAEALSAICPEIDAQKDDVAVFAGRLLWTKGLQYVVAALPLILTQRPRLHLLVAGEGPMHSQLDSLIGALDRGDIERARELIVDDPELVAVEHYGGVMPELDAGANEHYREAARGLRDRVHFLGHLSHERLAPAFAAADLSLAPSVFPEAFGLVSIEALAAGALPVATYQTGLKTPLDAISSFLADDCLRSLKHGASLTNAIASAVIHLLINYPTRDAKFREGLHQFARERFSWEIVARRVLELSR